MFRSYYLYGILSLVLFYVISQIITGSWNPFAMAKGKGNENFSASLLQMIVFTMLTIFAYCSVFAARVMELNGFLSELPGIPSNLMILMGISVVNAVGTRAITESQAGNGQLTTADNSSLTQDRDGRTDLVKIQMLIWTFIAVVVYLFIFGRFMSASCYLGTTVTQNCPTTLALPDIDTAFLTLIGVAHGAYVANKFASQPAVPAQQSSGTLTNSSQGNNQGNNLPANTIPNLPPTTTGNPLPASPNPTS